MSEEEKDTKPADALAAEFIKFADIYEVRRLMPEDADAFSLVIRGHLLLEHALINFLKNALPHSEELKSRLSFQHRVELNIATGLLPPDFGPFLEYVAELRNRYAHNLRFELAESDEATLVSMSPSTVRDLVSEYKTLPFPKNLRLAIVGTYVAIEGARKWLIDDAGRLGLISKTKVRAMLEAAMAVQADAVIRDEQRS